MIVHQKLLNNFTSLRILRYHLLEPSALLFRKVKLHVTSNFLKLVKELLLRGSKNIMDLVHLV